MRRPRPVQMLTLFLKHFSGYEFGGAVNLSVRSTLQPIQTAAVEDTIIDIKAVTQKVAFDILYCVLNFAFTFRVSATAHVYGYLCFLPKFLEFVGVDDIAGVFTHTNDAVLVED